MEQSYTFTIQHSIQIPQADIEKAQSIFYQSGHSFVIYYFSFVNEYQNDFDVLNIEFANLRLVRDWFTHHLDIKSARLLLDFIELLTSYLHRPELAHELLDFCEEGLQACNKLNSNPGWLLLLRYAAHNYLGNWSTAVDDAQSAIDTARGVDTETYARGMLALGSLQFNQGDYKTALVTLYQAEKILTQINDIEGVATARAQYAAYHLNRGELDQALIRYQEVDRLRRQIDPTGPTHHTLLMLGVVYRNKGDYNQGAKYLQQLLSQGQAENNLGVVATASHHLAWLYLRQQKIERGRQLAIQAKKLYVEINDPRGISDTNEQLGLLSIMDHKFDIAEVYFKQALLVRQNLQNKQGMANTLGLLADLYVRQHKIGLGLWYMCRSWIIYHRLGVLTYQQIIKKSKQFLQLAIKKHQ